MFSRYPYSPVTPFYYGLESTGNPACLQASNPPSNAAAFSIPFDLSVTTAPADVCSLGQEQYVTIVLSRGNSPMRSATSVEGINFAPRM